MQKINTFVVPIIHDQHIERFLDTLYEFTPPNFYVIVIDQTEGDSAFLRCHKKTHLWVKSYRNLGFSKAMNTGIRLAQTPYITLSNDDIELIHPSWWQGILDTFATSDRIVAVNPMSPKEGAFGYGLRADNDDTWQPPKGYARDGEYVVPIKPDRTPLTYKERFTDEDYNFLLNHHPSWQKDTVCDGLCMWMTVCKAEMFQTIGPLDERFYPGSGEDYDMNGRVYSCAWPKERSICDESDHKRMVSTTRSWVWHHWSSSKNYETIPLSRPSWNNLGELWPNGFDSWGHGTDDNGKKYPYKRVPEVFIDEL